MCVGVALTASTSVDISHTSAPPAYSPIGARKNLPQHSRKNVFSLWPASRILLDRRPMLHPEIPVIPPKPRLTVVLVVPSSAAIWVSLLAPLRCCNRRLGGSSTSSAAVSGKVNAAFDLSLAAAPAGSDEPDADQISG